MQLGMLVCSSPERHDMQLNRSVPGHPLCSNRMVGRTWFVLESVSALMILPSAGWADEAAAVPTAPVIVGFDKISAGDTAWMLTSSALVLMMTIPGLALFYGGMVRKKNILATLMQSFAITCVVTMLWWVIGYSWAFTPGSPYLGGSTRLLFNGM